VSASRRAAAQKCSRATVQQRLSRQQATRDKQTAAAGAGAGESIGHAQKGDYALSGNMALSGTKLDCRAMVGARRLWSLRAAVQRESHTYQASPSTN
jgi:hypothetical protein